LLDNQPVPQSGPYGRAQRASDVGAARAGEVDLIGRSLEPEHVADRVLRAIRASRLYVITHEEGLPALRRRFERMAQAVEESR
jgi:hypothetical protein